MPQRREPLGSYDFVRAIHNADAELDDSVGQDIFIRRAGTGQLDVPVEVRAVKDGILIITEPKPL